MKENLGVYYDQSSNFQQDQFEILRDLIISAVPVETVHSMLEIGCGSGVRTVEALKLFSSLEKVIAFDPDPEMLSVARKKYKDPKIKYYQLTAEKLAELPDADQEEFDAVLSHWVLHWVSDKDAMMEAMNAMTKPGTHFMFGTCQDLPQILKDIDEYIRSDLLLSPLVENPFHYLRKDEWIALLDKHGWEVVTIDARTVTHIADSAREYLDHWFSASTCKFLYGKQMEEISEISFDNLTWLMEKKYPCGRIEDGIEFTEDVLFCVARKK